jgi:hypothetical protein
MSRRPPAPAATPTRARPEAIRNRCWNPLSDRSERPALPRDAGSHGGGNGCPSGRRGAGPFNVVRLPVSQPRTLWPLRDIPCRNRPRPPGSDAVNHLKLRLFDPRLIYLRLLAKQHCDYAFKDAPIIQAVSESVAHLSQSVQPAGIFPEQARVCGRRAIHHIPADGQWA